MGEFGRSGEGCDGGLRGEGRDGYGEAGGFEGFVGGAGEDC